MSGFPAPGCRRSAELILDFLSVDVLTQFHFVVISNSKALSRINTGRKIFIVVWNCVFQCGVRKSIQKTGTFQKAAQVRNGVDCVQTQRKEISNQNTRLTDCIFKLDHVAGQSVSSV